MDRQISKNDKDQEQEYLPLLKGDPDIVAVYPERSRTGIFFDEDGEDHVKPYISDAIIDGVGGSLATLCLSQR